MEYYRVPEEISFNDLLNNKLSFSPQLYKSIIFKNKNLKKIKELLHDSNPYNKGSEPGSKNYLPKSTHFLIRTKALQDFSYLLYFKGESVIPVNPLVFEEKNLVDGDILMAKDSNVGSCAIINGNDWKNYMFSSGIVRLNPKIDKYYLFSFLKNPIFKLQLISMTPRGATISHAKELWLDCQIPFPNQQDSEDVIKLISSLVKVIIDKESILREKDTKIQSLISDELENGQKGNTKFCYTFPTFKEINEIKRLDAIIYDSEYKQKISKVLNYKGGFCSPSEMEFEVIPGPSLEIRILKTRIDSDIKKPGYYSLLLPTNISEFGTINKMQYLGTQTELPLLQQGDVVIGEAGYQKGRSLVLINSYDRCTTNAHGLYARRKDGNLEKSIFFRCIFNWYRKMGLIDIMGVGGSGGHFSPSYFDKYILVPKFPQKKVIEITSLYHNPKKASGKKFSLDNFVEWNQKWNTNLGIWELDLEIKTLKKLLADIHEKIIDGNIVEISTIEAQIKSCITSSVSTEADVEHNDRHCQKAISDF